MTQNVLIVHGLGGSGPDHWQTWLAERLLARDVSVSYPDLPDPDAPMLGVWLETLGTEVDRLGPDGLVVACHSLGAVTWMHLAAGAGHRLAERVLLVAPPSDGAGVEELAEFVPAPFDAAGIALAAGTSRVVCASFGDPYRPEDPGLFEPLGIPIDVIEGGGHLNTDAGYGPWPEVEAWCLDPGSVPVGSR